MKAVEIPGKGDVLRVTTYCRKRVLFEVWEVLDLPVAEQDDRYKVFTAYRIAKTYPDPENPWVSFGRKRFLTLRRDDNHLLGYKAWKNIGPVRLREPDPEVPYFTHFTTLKTTLKGPERPVQPPKMASDDPTHVKLHVCREFHKLCREAGVTGWVIQVRKRVRGRCRYFDKKVTLPMWAVCRSHEFAMYYMLHEFAHVMTRGHYHDKFFQRFEDQLLQRYGLRIRRKKVYPKAVYAGEREV